MGREQRSRGRLPADARCYLCGNPILPDEKWDRDHVPPKRVFALAVLQEHSPNLEWLYTHRACNRSYREDEEYFVVSFAGHVKTATATAVMNDIHRGAAKGHLVGLIKDVLSRFGKIIGPTGERTSTWDSARVERALWKIFRGIYALESSTFLPEQWIHPMWLVPPHTDPSTLEGLAWFPAVRDTQPLAKYGAVFDYKWIGWKTSENVRFHAMAMLFWDGLIVATIFHDPTCPCGEYRLQHQPVTCS